MDFLVKLLSVVLIAAVFTAIALFAVKKEKGIQNDLLSKLTNEQIEDLKKNEVNVKNDNQKKFSWYQKGLIGRVTVRGNNCYLKVLWYNTIIENYTLYDFQYADIKMKKDDFDRRGLKEGHTVKIFLEPYKPNAAIV